MRNRRKRVWVDLRPPEVAAASRRHKQEFALVIALTGVVCFLVLAVTSRGPTGAVFLTLMGGCSAVAGTMTAALGDKRNPRRPR